MLKKRLDETDIDIALKLEMGRLKDVFHRATSLVSRSNSEGRQHKRLPPPPPHNLQEEQPHRGSVKDRLALPVEDGRAGEVYLEVVFR